jgi:hypothetical protein
MDTTVTSITNEQTTTKEWKWTALEACDCGETDEERSDRMASLVGDEVRRLYEEMRSALNDAFDECYADPNQDNEEEYNDRQVEWLDGFEAELCDNPGVVRLVKDDDRYTLTARDAEGEQGGGRRMVHLDPSLSDEDISKRVRKFLTEQDPLGKIESLCAAELRGVLPPEKERSRSLAWHRRPRAGPRWPSVGTPGTRSRQTTPCRVLRRWSSSNQRPFFRSS